MSCRLLITATTLPWFNTTLFLWVLDNKRKDRIIDQIGILARNAHHGSQTWWCGVTHLPKGSVEQPQGWLSTTFKHGALLPKLAQGPQGRSCPSVIPRVGAVGILSSTRNTAGPQSSWPSLQLPLTFHHRSCRSGRFPTPQQKWLLQPPQATPRSSVCTVWGTGYINN